MKRTKCIVVITLFALLWSANAGCFAKPEMKVNNTIAVISHEFRRWSEGGFVALNDKDVFLVLAGYTGPWNHDWSPANIYGFWSHDGGNSWAAQENAVILQDAKSLEMQNVQSPALLKLQNGDVLLSFPAGKTALKKEINEREFGGVFIKRSTDNCKTWSKAKRIDKKAFALPGRNLQLQNGRIIFPAFTIPTGFVYVLYSDDNGQSWTRSKEIQIKQGGEAVKSYEPAIVVLKDGRLLMFIRSNIGQIYKSYSNDDDLSWSEPVPTGIPSPSSMATLTRLQNGDIMLIFNMVRDLSEIFTQKREKDALRATAGGFPRIRLCTMISKDDGISWGNLRFLDGSDDFGDVVKITMGSVCLLGKEDVLIGWSRAPKKSKKHYMNMYDYRYRKFNLDWLYAGTDPTTYRAPK